MENITRNPDGMHSNGYADGIFPQGYEYAPVYLEIRGREGSTAVCRKEVNCLADVSDAEVQKLNGIAWQLPAIAFDALCDPLTIEIMLNPNGLVWKDVLGGDMAAICTMREAEADEFIRKIAGYHKQTVTREAPILECVFPLDGSRFAGVIPPIVSHPVFSIRKRAVRVFTLEDYVAMGGMTARQCDLIRNAVFEKRNIIVLGGTSSGKTTLGNAVLNEITVVDPHCRQVIIEDTPELRSTAFNKVYLQTSPSCPLTKLLKTTLRLRPDRIIVGEVRGLEAFDLLQAWNTGHPGGVTTMHANNCVDGLRRLKSLVSQHEFAPEDIEPDIAVAIDVIVGIAKQGADRRVTEVISVQDYESGYAQNHGYHLAQL